MTVTGSGPAAPQGETVTQQAFAAFEQAIVAQHEVNEQADAEFERGYTTERGCAEHRAAIQTSRAAALVDQAEVNVKQRAAQADEQYQNLLAAMTQAGDAAQEQRNSRYANRVQRELDAAESPGQRVAVARQLMRQADPSQLGVLIEELPSQFPNTDTSWVEAELRAINPKLADAARTRQRATQSSQLASYAASQVRLGFSRGRPPVSVSSLAVASAKYDPDIPT